ncbi:MAG: PH domain-containing protein [Anaerolineae bacterium]|nr:PH domain-containing protein [Anaerolineae bacterium]NIN94438.1 PH domain-containing protein [Anaerolineae bacterium]NIQ77501.1 PH domain-containing protein [Anaerolineae bacterium]
MGTKSYKPSPRYLVKLCVGITIAAWLSIIGTLFLALVIPDREATIIFGLMALAQVVVWVLALILSAPFYASLRYEIQDDEVIVDVGIITHSVKHVPYRTVTNVVVRRDIFDRWFFGLGSLHIQTAGMSGQSGAEEKLVGLTNVQEAYDMVVKELRRFRGGMAPTAAEVEPEASLASADALSAILGELKAIRKALEQDQ